MKTGIIIYSVYVALLWVAMYVSLAYNMRRDSKKLSSQKDVTTAIMAITLIAIFWPLVVVIGILVVVCKAIEACLKMLGKIITPRYLKEQFALDERDKESDEDPEFAENYSRLLDELTDDLDFWNDTSEYSVPDNHDN